MNNSKIPRKVVRKKKNREIEALQLQYNLLNSKMSKMEAALKDIEDRDDNIYRTIFEAEPLPKTIRYGGYGGSNKYSNLEGFENSDLLLSSTERLDRLTKQLYIQSKSFEENGSEYRKNISMVLWIF